MWCRVGGEMPATHTHGAAAEMGAPATAEVSAATATTEVSAATAATEVSAATAATEVSAATTSAAKMSTTTTTTTAASRVSGRRQTKGNGYCGRACRDFPHGTPRRG